MVMLSYAHRLNGTREVALTKLDVLSGIPELKIAIAYKSGSKIIKEFPTSLSEVEKSKPIFQTFKGWNEDISTIRSFSKLPINCRKYIEAIEKMLGVPIKYISVGAERSAIIKH